MRSKISVLITGSGLILVGILIFLDNFMYIHFFDEYIGTVIFGLASVLFYTNYAQDRRRWWGLVLGSFSLLLAYVFFVKGYFWIREGTVGIAFCLLTALTFLMVFLRNTRQWWAVIPAGFWLTITAIVFIKVYDLYVNDQTVAFIFFLGLALTFGVLYLLNNPERPMTWAAYPFLGLLAIALMVGFFDTYSIVGEIIVPSVLIISGLFMLIKSATQIRKGKDNHAEVH